ncbi:MAG: trigger factor [Lachnospiraceae bacterium]|nr:trigger factor [Lachnospiraceae bacterium]
MRRKNLMTALLCAAVVAASTVMAPGAVMAEETEAVTEASTEAATEADTEASTEASSEEELEITERPDYKALDYVELGEYKGLTVEVSPTTVTDEEVLKQIRANAGSDILEEVTEGTVEEGDTANIDYEGKLDGEAFDGGTAKDTDLEIGSGTFIPGFEDGLIGVKIGDTVDLPLTFPENYTEELAGKDVVFTVTVNSVKRMPELTDDLVNQITDGEYTDVDSYKESVRKDLEDAKVASRPSEINNSLLTQIAATSTIKEYPQELVDYAANNMKNYYKQQAESSNMEFADFLSTYFSMDEDTFNEQVELVVKQNLRAELYLKAIAEAEDIELTDEEYEAKCEEFAENYGYDSVEKFKAAYTEDEIRLSALEDKVLEFLSDNATIVEKSEDETEASSEASTEAASEDGTEAAAETETEAATEASTEAATDAE